MTHRIYTLGYEGSSPDDIRRYVKELHAVLVDIRMSPHSRAAMWEGKALSWYVGGANYMHLVVLGNENYRHPELGIKLHNPQAGVRALEPVLRRRSIILLCACANLETCHRKVAAEYLHQVLGVKVSHLPARFSNWERERARWDEQKET